jgi:hypothetical protein
MEKEKESLVIKKSQQLTGLVHWYLLYDWQVSFLKNKFLGFLVGFGGAGILTQGLALAGQALYHLSYDVSSPRPSFLLFEMESH